MRVARVTPSESSSTPSGSSYAKSGGIPSLDDPNRRICWCSFQGSAPLDRLGGRRNSLGSASRIGWLIPASYSGQLRSASATCDRKTSPLPNGATRLTDIKRRVLPTNSMDQSAAAINLQCETQSNGSSIASTCSVFQFATFTVHVPRRAEFTGSFCVENNKLLQRLPICSRGKPSSTDRGARDDIGSAGMATRDAWVHTIVNGKSHLIETEISRLHPLNIRMCNLDYENCVADAWFPAIGNLRKGDGSVPWECRFRTNYGDVI